MAGEDEHTGIGTFGTEPVGESGLADTGLAADERKAALPRKGGGEVGTQETQFMIAPDEGQAGNWRSKIHANPLRQAAFATLSEYITGHW
jgi:hypothetical protein